MGSYYIVRHDIKCLVTGPHDSWQQACLEAFACIRDDMRVKCIGDCGIKAKYTRYIKDETDDPSGWFRPLISNEVGYTLNPEEAKGPPEIAKELIELTQSIRHAQTTVDCEIYFNRASEFFGKIPEDFGLKLTDIFNAKMAELTSVPTIPDFAD